MPGLPLASAMCVVYMQYMQGVWLSVSAMWVAVSTDKVGGHQHLQGAFPLSHAR